MLNVVGAPCDGTRRPGSSGYLYTFMCHGKALATSPTQIARAYFLNERGVMGMFY